MDPLAQELIDAYGGLDRWRRFDTVDAHLFQGGALWQMKGQAGVLDDTRVTVHLKEEWASHAPFGEADRSSIFTPDRVALFAADGMLEDELLAPRQSFAGHQLDTSWTELQLAYFAGCAMWTYLNLPFLLAEPGVETRAAGDWQERGETWRRLAVRFPTSIATHSSEQMLYVGSDGLLRRHDYDVEIAGNTPGAHYLAEHVEVEGIRFPTRRRIFPRQADGQALDAPLVVSFDLDDIRLG